MPAYTVTLLEHEHGSLDGQRVVVLGAAYRGGVKETAFSGVFGVVTALEKAGATALVHDPMYSDDELAGLSFQPYSLGEPVDAAILQADHPGYADLGPEHLPGVRTFIDGRGVTDAAQWPGVRHRVLGRG